MNAEQRTEEPVVTRTVAPEESFSEAVVEAVAAVANADAVPDGAPESGETLDPLYEAIDPDALDALFRPAGPEFARNFGRVTFRYHGYEVTVHSEGEVIVERLGRTGESSD